MTVTEEQREALLGMVDLTPRNRAERRRAKRAGVIDPRSLPRRYPPPARISENRPMRTSSGCRRPRGVSRRCAP